MKPITDCEYSQEDGCCGYPDAPTPECHTGACPRLDPFIDDATDACQAAYDLLVGWHPQYPDDMRKKAQVIKMLSNVLASAPKREE